MSLTLNLEPIIKEEMDKYLKSIGLDSKLEELINNKVKEASKNIRVEYKDKVRDMGLQHKQFETLLHLVAMKENVMITGEAGLGKSHMVQQVAKALDLPFHSISVSNQTTKTDLLGFVDANGVYRYNGFISAFKDGGIFNMDEIDAGNENVLVVLNSALSNGFVEAPNGEMLYRNENFRFVCTANTVGRGANRQYVGRNKLDLATLDRFTVLEMEIDTDVETMLCGGNSDYVKTINIARDLVADSYEDFLISQRTSTRLYKFLTSGLFTVEQALDMAMLKGCSKDIKDDIMSLVAVQLEKFIGEQEEVKEEPKEVKEEIPEPEDDYLEEDDDEEFEW